MAAANDQILNKYGGLIAGGIVLILFAYVISVFVVYGIEKEKTTIGASYALGVNRNQLMLHYLCHPVVVSFLAGAIGCMIGFASIGDSTIMGSCYEYFSISQIQVLPFMGCRADMNLRLLFWGYIMRREKVRL